MGEIVAAVGTCHTPYLFTQSSGREPAAARCRLPRRCRSSARSSTRPSRTSSCFSAAITSRPFRSTCIPTLLHHRRQPRHRASSPGASINLPIHREMAEDILNKLVIEKNFDIAYSEDAELGHAFAVPFEFVIGKRDIPVIPFFTNVYVPPLPTPQRCAALGKALARDRQGPQGARRDHRQRRACRTSPGTTKYLHARIRFRSLARRRSSRRATPTRC